MWCGTNIGTVFQISLASKSILGHGIFSSGHTMNVTSFHVDQNGRIISTSFDCSIALWDSILGDVTAKRLSFGDYFRSFKPKKTCEVTTLEDCRKALIGVGSLEEIVRESVCFARDRISSLQASGVDGILTEDEAVAIGIYSYDLGLLSQLNGRDNFYYLVNSALRKREALQISLLKTYLFYLFQGLSHLPPLKCIGYRGIPSTEMAIVKANYTTSRVVSWSGMTSL